MRTDISVAINLWNQSQKAIPEKKKQENRQKAIDKVASLRTKYEKHPEVFEKLLTEQQYKKGVSIK